MWLVAFSDGHRPAPVYARLAAAGVVWTPVPAEATPFVDELDAVALAVRWPGSEPVEIAP